MLRWLKYVYLVFVAALCLFIGLEYLVLGPGSSSTAKRERQNLYWINSALQSYASNHSGAYPIGVTTHGTLLTNAPDIRLVANANQALGALLVSDVTVDRRMFADVDLWPLVPSTHDLRNDAALRPGYNTYTYFAGRTTASDPSLPLVASFTWRPWTCVPGKGWRIDDCRPVRRDIPKPGVFVLSVDGTTTQVDAARDGSLFLPDTNAGITAFALAPVPPPDWRPPMTTTTKRLLIGAVASAIIGLLLTRRLRRRPRAATG